MNSMNENIIPYQSCSKSVFIILGVILMCWCSFFSIFLGVEYLVMFYLIHLYFKEKNIKDEINIDQKIISIKKFINVIF